jgi:cytochrome c biogenesis protein
MAASSGARLRASFALVWRTLRSMRTALILLLLIAVAAIGGSLVPQRGVNDAKVDQIIALHPFRGELFRRLGLFDVYGSWWFTLIYTLLLISLAACLFPRSRALIRNLFAKPQLVRELDGFRHYAERPVDGAPDAALTRARRVLRRRRFRVRGPDGSGRTIAAEKGFLREAGSLVFHWSFFVLLIGVIYGKGTGFTGTAVIAEGETWAEVHAGYDGQIREGRFLGEDHSGLLVHVEDFRVTYRPDGSPSEFVTTADLAAPGGESLGRADIRVNHPGTALGVRLFQAGYGWAPVVRVEDRGRAIASIPLIFVRSPAKSEAEAATLPWRGVLRLPSLRPQVAIEFALFPDSRALAASLTGGEAPPMLVAHEPLMLYTAYRGELPLTANQTLTTLDTTGMERFDSGVVGVGQRVALTEGVELAFPELREYTVLQVSRDRGVGVVALAGILILLGLLPALYDSRRKLWVRAGEREGVTVLEVGGFALQRRDQFEEEFARLVEELGAPAQAKERG